MRRDILIIGAALVVCALIALILLSVLGPAHAEITAVTTDKDLYHSNENLNITILINSAGNMDNTTARIEGIRDENGKMRISHEMPANLTAGPNILFYQYKLPSCSKCSGLEEGTYQVNVTLIRNSAPISNMTHSFELRQ
jgi:uncharacterized membrane protein